MVLFNVEKVLVNKKLLKTFVIPKESAPIPNQSRGQDPVRIKPREVTNAIKKAGIQIKIR
ncbi:MAG: hypothetical protein WCB89_09240 [Methanobacterium sp.]